MEYFLIGYFPKRIVTRTNWQVLQKEWPESTFPAPTSVHSICSASNCISKGPRGFDFPEISEQSFNQYGGFNRLDDAKSAIPPKQKSEFALFAYAVPEWIYEEGKSIPAEIGCVEPEEMPNDGLGFQKLGFDVIDMSSCNIGHSPLSCNGQAGLHESKVNSYCLVDKEEDALQLAELFSIEKPEPGNYMVIEIWILSDSFCCNEVLS